ncbi:MAG: hypothetical protein JO119_19915 [Acidobacteria bacterium]|nr:hypothetical protein [Acidobacteriota bacterium]
MSIQDRSVQWRPSGSAHSQPGPLSYKSIIGRLLSEMAVMVRATESRTFDGPYRLLIVSNQGGVVFSGEIDSNGRIRCATPTFKIRRSHFPANVVITDGSNAVRTFRIDRHAMRPRHA